MEQEFVALLGSRVQWVFNRSRMLRKQSAEGSPQTTATNNRQYLSLVISGAGEYVEMEKERLVEAGMEDLRRVFPDARLANVVHALVIKEKRATFSPKPGVEPLRPSPQTVFENLILAGDWTDTGLPSTIEGAVISGRRASHAVASYLASM
jgi:zeta-carotene desaturase